MATPLKLVRLRSGISPSELAARLRVSQPTICRIENGKNRPRPALLKQLVDFFGGQISRDQILFPEDYPEPETRKPVPQRLRKAS